MMAITGRICVHEETKLVGWEVSWRQLSDEMVCIDRLRLSFECVIGRRAFEWETSLGQGPSKIWIKAAK
jgi:hypothetical protein